jgi:hypothetical protein
MKIQQPLHPIQIQKILPVILLRLKICILLVLYNKVHTEYTQLKILNETYVKYDSLINLTQHSTVLTCQDMIKHINL